MQFKKHLQRIIQKSINFFKKNKYTARLYFFIIGISSTIWFLGRVIQKPSRITYPCMQATAPIMSAFLLWIFNVAITVFSFRKAKAKWGQSKYSLAIGLFVFAFASGSFLILQNTELSFAGITSDAPMVTELTDPRNDPMGDGYGIYNGRVVWVHDADATNENCTNSDPDYWFTDANTDQGIVDTMLANGIKKVAGENSVSAAWNALFKYHNKKKGRGNNGYTSGEKICIKLNLVHGTKHTDYYSESSKMDVAPQLVLALLKQLINKLGVSQEDITIGDPFRNFFDIHWDKCHSVFPDVNYIDRLGYNDRQLTEMSDSVEFYTSDSSFSSKIPKAYVEADYFINMPCLKSHSSAGITIAAKNHQGSVIGTGQVPSDQQMSNDLHYCFPTSDGYKTMGHYRHLVDYMGHKYMGDNTVIYIVDALWTGHDWDGIIYKWQMDPFYGDYMSSLFLSQDPVAIESVGFDFLFSEYLQYPSYHGGSSEAYPLYEATQDYIHQAADTSNWPDTITYDPERDGTPLKSLGVHEHWNNASDKEYTGNQGAPGGIHLVSIPSDLVYGSTLNYPKDTGSTLVKNFEYGNLVKEFNVFPNPTKGEFNVQIIATVQAECSMALYDMKGQKVADLGTFSHLKNGAIEKKYNMLDYHLTKGIYLCKLNIISGNQNYHHSQKIMFTD